MVLDMNLKFKIQKLLATWLYLHAFISVPLTTSTVPSTKRHCIQVKHCLTPGRVILIFYAVLQSRVAGNDKRQTKRDFGTIQTEIGIQYKENCKYEGFVLFLGGGQKNHMTL